MKPRLAIFWTVANQSFDTVGSVIDTIPTKGWKHTLDASLRPQIEWAKEYEPVVIAHLCFGQYGPGDDDMRIDAYDWAKASGQTKLFDQNQFAAAWAPYVNERTCIAYVGDADRMPWIQPNEFRLMVERNLAPYLKAGFHRVCIDASGDAIVHAATVGPDTFNRSVNSLILAYGDAKFPQLAMVEATPKNARAWRSLAKRDVICNEALWRRRHGKASERSGTSDAKGYGDPAYMIGTRYRIVDNGAPEQMIADAKRIAGEGDVPCVQCWPLIKAGVKAADLLGEGK